MDVRFGVDANITIYTVDDPILKIVFFFRHARGRTNLTTQEEKKETFATKRKKEWSQRE